MSALNSNTSSLPAYAPSAPSPNYTCEPNDNEQTLQQTPSQSSTTPTGTYIKRSEKVTVTLFDQETGVKLPTYGRHGLINGMVCLENTQIIFKVVVKIEGELESNSSKGPSNLVKLVNDYHTLWEKADKNSACPSHIPFSCVLPTTYDYDNCRFPLPPSYTHDDSSMVVKSRYSIYVYVERIRHPMVGFLPTTKRIVIPFNYYPRTRAHRPIIARPCFFSAVKASPEEWYQAFSEVKTRPNFRLDPVYCHLFLPAALVYGLKDAIPFRVQLNGPLHSVKKFLLLPEDTSAMSEPSQSRKHPPLQCSSRFQPTVKVSLMRQLIIETGGRKIPQTVVLSKGQLQEVPPAHTSCESQDAIHLDWEGEVKCADDVSVGGFVAGNVAVKDFVSVRVEPPMHKTEVSPFFAIHITVPIRLVTDSYVEVTDYEGRT